MYTLNSTLFLPHMYVDTHMHILMFLHMHKLPCTTQADKVRAFSWYTSAQCHEHTTAMWWTHFLYLLLQSLVLNLQGVFLSLEPVVLLLHAHLKVSHAGLPDLLNFPPQTLALKQQLKEQPLQSQTYRMCPCAFVCMHTHVGTFANPALS